MVDIYCYLGRNDDKVLKFYLNNSYYIIISYLLLHSNKLPLLSEHSNKIRLGASKSNKHQSLIRGNTVYGGTEAAVQRCS